MADTIVSNPSAAPHDCDGKFFLLKLVTAVGTINTDNPNIAADTSKPEAGGNTRGKSVSMAVARVASAKGISFAQAAVTCRHKNGDTIIVNPTMNQTTDTMSA